MNLKKLSNNAGGIIWSPDSKRRDSEGDPGLELFDSVVGVFDHLVYVLPPPIVFLQRSTGRYIHIVGCIVRKSLVVIVGRVGIEVIVIVEAVNVVPRDDITNHSVCMTFDDISTRVKPQILP